ncbi:hydroxyethylthiazole kinase, partial [Corynebacterium nasicanis]
ARALAERTGGVVAVSGPVDLIVSAGRSTWLTSGDPLLTLVSGTGCALGALCAAYLGLGADPHDAVLAAHAHTGAAAQLAARSATGPGGFSTAWLDALHHLTSAEIADLVSWKDPS